MVNISIIFFGILSGLVYCQDHPPCTSTNSQQGFCYDIPSIRFNCKMVGSNIDQGNCTGINICCPQAQIISPNPSSSNKINPFPLINFNQNTPLPLNTLNQNNPSSLNNLNPNSFLQLLPENMPNPSYQFNPANLFPSNMLNPSSPPSQISSNNPNLNPSSIFQTNGANSNPFPSNNLNLFNPFGSNYPPYNANPNSNNLLSNPFGSNYPLYNANPNSNNLLSNPFGSIYPPNNNYPYLNNPFNMNSFPPSGLSFSPNNNANLFSMNSNGQVCSNTRNTNVPYFHSRILGGSPANQSNFCWQVIIMEEGTNVFCGSGSLITQRYVITAASVVKRAKSGRLRIILGDMSTNCIQQVSVTSVNFHQQYNLPSYKSENNIALLQLSTPAETTKICICTICLPSPDSDFSGQIATVSGYGSTTEEGTYPNFPLMKTEVPILSNMMCQMIFQHFGLNMDISSQICAGGRGQDSCKGDGGGPLTFIDAIGTPYIVGIVSTGIGCGKQGVPGIYTSVSKNYDFIINSAV